MKINKLILVAVSVIFTSNFAMAMAKAPVDPVMADLMKQDKILTSLKVGLAHSKRDRNSATIDLLMDAFQGSIAIVATKSLAVNARGFTVFPKTVDEIRAFGRAHPGDLMEVPLRAANWTAVKAVQGTGLLLVLGSTVLSVAEVIRVGGDIIQIVIETKNIASFNAAIDMEMAKLREARKNIVSAGQ